MGCAGSSGEDVSDRTPVDTITAIMETWGSGGYADPKTGDKLIARDFDAACKTDGSGDFKNTDGYKVYEGVAGVKEWLAFLGKSEYPDFKVESMEAAKDDATKVNVTVSYGLYNKETCKSSDKKFTDQQEWVVKDGQVTSGKFIWGDVAGIDALFAVTDAEKLVLQIHGEWGAGKFHGDGGKEAAGAYITDATVIEASGTGYEWKNTTGYKTYGGLDGFMEWMAFLGGLEFPEFKLNDVQQQQDGTVALKMSSKFVNKETGKACDGTAKNAATWTIADGKFAKIVFTWDPAFNEQIDATFVK